MPVVTNKLGHTFSICQFLVTAPQVREWLQARA